MTGSKSNEGQELGGATVYTNNPDSPFVRWMHKHGASVEAKSSFEWRWNEAGIGEGEVPCGKCGKMHDPSIEPAPFVAGSELPCCMECVEADPSATAGYVSAVEEAKAEMKAAIAALEDVALRLSVSRSLREGGPFKDKCHLCDCDGPALRKASMVNVCAKCWDDATWPNFPDLIGGQAQ